MARISDLNKYYYDYNISDKDYLIGSNGDINGKTQNYSILSLAQYFAQYFQNVNEIDPTVPQWVKNITQQDISLWNTPRTDENVSITEATNFAQIGQNQKDFNKNVSDYKGVVDSNIQGLQIALDGKQDKLSSYDESILIESDGNIEGNVSLFEEYFEQQECELNFTPIQIVGVYVNGIKLLKSEYEIILPKKIKIKEYVDENIQIQYTKLKI